MTKKKSLLKSGTDILIGTTLIGATGQVGKGVPFIGTVQTLQSVGLIKKAKKDFGL